MNNLDFSKLNGLIPAIIQDAVTKNVLMLGFMNQEALNKTLQEKRVTFYSRTKQRLWTKGEESGHFLNVVEIKVDCDSDTLLILVNPEGATCHTGSDTCFQTTNTEGLMFLKRLEEIINDRKNNPTENSYTVKLFNEGTDRIIQKVGEECVEVIIAAKNNDKQTLMSEVADLFYHLLVLFNEKGITLDEIGEFLKKRHLKK